MLNLAGIALRGSSVGGMETCIELPGYDLCLDIGRCPRWAVQRSRVLISHGHMDHLGGVAIHAATRALTHLSPPTYFVPREIVRDLENLFHCWRRLDGSRLPVEVIPVSPGDRFPIGPDQELRAFRTIHSLPSLGYTIWSRKRKLKAEYIGLPGDRIRDLRLSGVPVVDDHWTADLGFVGDSRIDILDQEPSLQEVRLLIIEVTFLDDRVDVAACRGRGHIHLDEVVERLDRFRNHAILFTHFSARYGRREILHILEKRLPAEFRRRMVPLLSGIEEFVEAGPEGAPILV